MCEGSQLSLKWEYHTVQYYAILLMLGGGWVGNILLISKTDKLIKCKGSCFKAVCVNPLSFTPLASQLSQNESLVLSTEFSAELLIVL